MTKETCLRPVWSVFAVRMKKAWVLNYPLSAQRRRWSNWADAHAILLVLSWGDSYVFQEGICHRMTWSLMGNCEEIQRQCQHHASHWLSPKISTLTNRLPHFTCENHVLGIGWPWSSVVSAVETGLFTTFRFAYEPRHDKTCFCHMRTRKASLLFAA